MRDLYCKSGGAITAAGGTADLVIDLARPGVVVAIAVAARDSSSNEIPRRLLGLRLEAGGTTWPREGANANAELVTGDGRQLSDLGFAALVESDGTGAGKVTVTVKNYHASTAISAYDVALWVEPS